MFIHNRIRLSPTFRRRWPLGTRIRALTNGILRRRRGVLFKPKTIVSMSYFGLIDPGFCTRFLWPYLLFFRPGFHPWQTDDSELVKRYSDLLASDAAD